MPGAGQQFTVQPSRPDPVRLRRSSPPCSQNTKYLWIRESSQENEHGRSAKHFGLAVPGRVNGQCADVKRRACRGDGGAAGQEPETSGWPTGTKKDFVLFLSLGQ